MYQELKNKIALVVSPDRAQLKTIKEHLNATGLFYRCYSAFSGAEALEKMEEQTPDLAIVELIMAEMDGLALVEQIKSNPETADVKVIMVSTVAHDFVVKKAFDYGADFYMVKPIDFRTFKARIEDILERPAEQNQVALPVRVTDILQDIGFVPNMKGFKYIRYAICLAAQDQTYLESLTQRLYGDVAKKFGTTAVNVERDIRHAIESAWNKGNVKKIEQHFGYSIDASKGKPTNSALIATIVDRLVVDNLKID